MASKEFALPPNRKFGAFFAAVFTLLAVFFLLGGSIPKAAASVFVASVFASLAYFQSGLLTPLNHLWMRLGLVLGIIVTPLVLGSIFFLMITPTALLMRLAGRDELQIRARNSDSYWKLRDSQIPVPESFRNQF